MKKLLRLLVLVTVFTCACSGAARAAGPPDVEVETAARELAALGLLRGGGQGLALEEPCDRLQGAALFTRLLGREEEATARLRPHPFRDIAAANWAAPYVAYLYNRGLAYGVAYNEYGLGALSPYQFATFCLRALDYTEGSVNSDFYWSEALDFMVLHGIISGSLRNRLAAAPLCRRGDAALLAYATLAAELKEGGQTLLQRLVEEGAVTAEQAEACGAWPAALRIAYPTGLLDASLLKILAAEEGLSLAVQPYAPTAQAEEDIYRQLREQERSFDICVLPGYLAGYLREEGLLAAIPLRDFGGEEAFIPQLRANPYWRDAELRRYYAVPLAFELPLLYYDSARIQNPDWSWLFRAAYSGGVYMPADAAKLIPLALHYYNLPYDTAEDKKLLPAIKLLSGQAAATPAYLDEHMLDIAERPGAALGVISSRDLPELARRQEENAAYAQWRAILPPHGGPLNVYYAVLAKNGSTKAASAFLQALLQPASAAAHAQLGGYLPTLRGAGSLLSGALAAACPFGLNERCRPLDLDRHSRLFYEQTMRNVFLDEAQNTVQPAIVSLEFSFTRAGALYRSCRVDFAHKEAATTWGGEGESELPQTITRALRDDQAKACRKELTRLGLALWKEYYDGPADGPAWELQMVLADGAEKNCQGQGLPPLWPELAAALLALSGVELIPPTL